MSTEKTFYGETGRIISNFEHFEEGIFDNTFKQISREEMLALLDEDIMKKYIDDVDHSYSWCVDEEDATIPLTEEEKKLVAEHLREAILDILKHEEEEEDEEDE